jgi:2-polyprenyl-3-methyl-5-hydroxy-6-metoxy-1,4-benzoquinol methylase
MDVTPINECFCCGNGDLKTVLDLTDQPLANSYLVDKNQDENIYPLKLNFCEKCTHLQLTHQVNPDLLFRDYLYVTGTSKTLRDYSEWFVAFSESYLVVNNKKVLDIACNDGTLLNYYQDAGYGTYGIDPSENLFELSSKRHNVVCDYLNEKYAEENSNKFDVIVAQNVFAHNAYPLDFLKMCKTMVSDTGLIFIQTSQANMVPNNEFDTIYHEHLSFFSEKSFRSIVERAGLYVNHITQTHIHGNSWVIVLSRSPIGELPKENYYELDSDVIKHYADSCYNTVKNLKSTLESLKEEGYRIVGYGAAAKGNTLLNFGEIDLDYIVDDNELKQGLFTPGRRIEIRNPSVLSEETQPVAVVPLAWNFFNEIKRNCQKLLTVDSIFVRYFPKISIE